MSCEKQARLLGTEYDIAVIDERAAWTGVENDDAADEPNGDFDVLESGEAAESVAAKGDICDFDDSREKLEADVREFVECTLKRGNLTYGAIMKMLDRQAAIMEADCFIEYEDMRDYLQAEIAKRDKRIAELEAELRRSYDAQGVKAEELTLRAVRISELEEQVDKLTAERDEWRAKFTAAIGAIEEPSGWRDENRELYIKVDELEAERDEWRMRCGKLLDAAHAMQGVADAWDEEV